MSRVKNPNTVAGVIHQVFHLLARKYKVNVDKIAAIIEDYDKWMNKHLVRVAAKKVRSKTSHYGKIIRVFAPCDFYWTKDGKFDGCDFDLSERKVTRHQERLINDVLDAIIPALEADDASSDNVPDAIKKNFRNRL